MDKCQDLVGQEHVPRPIGHTWSRVALPLVGLGSRSSKGSLAFVLPCCLPRLFCPPTTLCSRLVAGSTLASSPFALFLILNLNSNFSCNFPPFLLINRVLFITSIFQPYLLLFSFLQGWFSFFLHFIFALYLWLLMMM